MQVNLNSASRAAFCLLLIFLQIGCARPLGETRFPEASPGFYKQEAYPVPAAVVWEAVDTALLKNRIAVASADKAAGNLTTDYIAGQGQMNAYGLLGIISTRYRYNIRLKPVRASETELYVFCTLESSGNELQAWRDVSNENRALVQRLEAWLCEQIDLELQ